MVYIFKNYRSVSLLCVFSKVFEKVIDFWSFFLISQSIISGSIGMWKTLFFKQVFMILINKLISSFDIGEMVIDISFDFPKSVGTVDHEILLQKLFY